MRRVFWSWTRLLAAVGTPSAQLDQARVFAAQGRHVPAMRVFARAAQAGSAAACFELGRAYLLGLGLAPCPGSAVLWLSKAAHAGQADAQLMLASLALQGITKPASDQLFETRQKKGIADHEVALHWARVAVRGGSARAQALLGFILTTGLPEHRDLGEGSKAYQLAAAGGSPYGQLGWSLALLKAGAVEQLPKIRMLLRNSAKSGLPVAHYLLGIITESGLDGHENPIGAARHFREGAELGHGPSQLHYGLALMRGHGVPKDLFHAETWLRRAALNGEMQAAATLGEFYAQLGELPANYAEAMIWLRRAAEGGHGHAARTLARLYSEGCGVAADPNEAAHWLRIAAEHGNTEACNEIAALALSHSGTELDRATTLRSFRALAEAGDAAAAFNLGLCCAEGIGMQRDYTQAMRWFQQAAKDLPIAEYWHARMLVENRGEKQDLSAARAMFLHAAEQGLREAEVAAGEMLANGRGGPPNPVMAKALFHRAAAAGHAGALFALGMLARGACGEYQDETEAMALLRRAAIQGHPRAREILCYESQEDRSPDVESRSDGSLGTQTNPPFPADPDNPRPLPEDGWPFTPEEGRRAGAVPHAYERENLQIVQ